MDELAHVEGERLLLDEEAKRVIESGLVVLWSLLEGMVGHFDDVLLEKVDDFLAVQDVAIRKA
jgi:hypothetical protein